MISMLLPPCAHVLFSMTLSLLFVLPRLQVVWWKLLLRITEPLARKRSTSHIRNGSRPVCLHHHSGNHRCENTAQRGQSLQAVCVHQSSRLPCGSSMSQISSFPTSTKLMCVLALIFCTSAVLAAAESRAGSVTRVFFITTTEPPSRCS